MFDVTIQIISWGKLIKRVRRSVDYKTLRALRTIHGSYNVIINL